LASADDVHCRVIGKQHLVGSRMRVNPAENYRNTVIFLELCGQSTHLLILDGLNMEADEVGLQFDDPLQDQILLVQQPGQPGNGQIILVVKQGLVVNQ